MRQCQVAGCTRDADYEVFLCDFHPASGAPQPGHRLDPTCPFICERHAQENEASAEGDRKARGSIAYPYTNRHRAQGLTFYRPIAPYSA